MIEPSTASAVFNNARNRDVQTRETIIAARDSLTRGNNINGNNTTTRDVLYIRDKKYMYLYVELVNLIARFIL